MMSISKGSSSLFLAVQWLAYRTFEQGLAGPNTWLICIVCSHCQRICPFINSDHRFKDDYLGKQTVAWKEYRAKHYALAAGITELMLKMVLYTIQLLNQYSRMVGRYRAASIQRSFLRCKGGWTNATCVNSGK